MHTHPATPPLDLADATVRRYLTWVLAAGITTLAIPAATDLPAEPFLLVLVYVVLLGGAIATARRSGPDGVRQLFRGVVHWRIGWRNWLLAAGALPLASVAIALATGTFVSPESWLEEVGGYLFLTFVFGALIVNVFEETAWQGLVQRHLTHRHGPARAAAFTAVPFAAVHLPLSFVGDPTPSEALVATVVLFLFAPAMRLLMGRMDATSGGSLLAVGVMHASFNASGQLGVLDGDWQPIGALVAVTTFLLMHDARRTRRGPETNVHRTAGHDHVRAEEGAS
jgi:uncharacterized protein